MPSISSIMSDIIVTIGRISVDWISTAYDHGYRDAMRDVRKYADRTLRRRP